MRAGRTAEGGPSVLLPPLERLVRVPCGAVRAHGAEVPVVLLGIVEVVRRPDIGGALCVSTARESRAQQDPRENEAECPRHLW